MLGTETTALFLQDSQGHGRGRLLHPVTPQEMISRVAKSLVQSRARPGAVMQEAEFVLGICHSFFGDPFQAGRGWH